MCLIKAENTNIFVAYVNLHCNDVVLATVYKKQSTSTLCSAIHTDRLGACDKFD